MRDILAIITKLLGGNMCAYFEFERHIWKGNTVMLGTNIVILGTNTDIFSTFVIYIVKGNKLKSNWDTYTKTLKKYTHIGLKQSHILDK